MADGDKAPQKLSQCNRPAIFPNEAKWIMLGHQQELVSRDLACSSCIPPAQGCTARMKCNRIRYIPSGVSLGRTAYPKIHIFEIRLKSFVETADPLKELHFHQQ